MHFRRSKDRPIAFPFSVQKNGRVGKIHKWKDKYATTFKFRGKSYRNSFKTFEAAYEYLSEEFLKLDSAPEDSSGLFPLRFAQSTYHQLEKHIEAKSPSSTIKDAVEFYLAHLGQPKITEHTTEECANRFIADKENTKVTPLHLKSVKKHLKRFCSSFANRPISSITADEVNQFLFNAKDPRNGNPWSAKTRNSVRSTLITLGIYARDVLLALPETQIKTVFHKSSLTKADPHQAVDIYSPEEIRDILQTAIEEDIELLPVIVLGAFQGLRPFEAHGEQLKREKLNWADFNWQRKILTVKGQKVRSKRSRQLELHPATYAWLYPFSHLSGYVWKLTQSHSRRLQRLRALAGIRAVGNGFRHSYASYRLAVTNGDLTLVSKEMGNSPNELIASYRKDLLPEQGQEWFAIFPPEGYEEKIRSLAIVR